MLPQLSFLDHMRSPELTLPFFNTDNLGFIPKLWAICAIEENPTRLF
jgi:hypothetical protein